MLYLKLKLVKNCCKFSSKWKVALLIIQVILSIQHTVILFLYKFMNLRLCNIKHKMAAAVQNKRTVLPAEHQVWLSIPQVANVGQQPKAIYLYGCQSIIQNSPCQKRFWQNTDSDLEKVPPMFKENISTPPPPSKKEKFTDLIVCKF